LRIPELDAVVFVIPAHFDLRPGAAVRPKSWRD
jgi:hypothetical protein